VPGKLLGSRPGRFHRSRHRRRSITCATAQSIPPARPLRRTDCERCSSDGVIRPVPRTVGQTDHVSADREASERFDTRADRSREGGVATDDSLKQFVRDQAWGHHASCTCPIGPRAGGGVLTSDFQGSRRRAAAVIDASVFPRVPGLFIVSAILHDCGESGRRHRSRRER